MVQDEEKSLDRLEEYEMEETAPEEELAVAETVLANILVRRWLAVQKDPKG